MVNFVEMLGQAPLLVPSLLSCDRADLLSSLRPLFAAHPIQRLHFDVMDGYFVPNMGFCPRALCDLRSALAREGIPCPHFGVHLMVRRPSRFLPHFASAGAALINFHWESDDGASELSVEVAKFGIRSGLCLNPETPFAHCRQILDRFALLLLMGVTPGFGGQSLLPNVLEKIREAAEHRRREGLSYAIAVDGGIRLDNAAELTAAGADFLIAGNAIFAAKNPPLAYGSLLRAARRNEWAAPPRARACAFANPLAICPVEEIAESSELVL
jgi:ribulose-phosphate 3-epimerase